MTAPRPHPHPGLVRGFHDPAHPLDLRPLKDGPVGPGVYFRPGVLATPGTVETPLERIGGGAVLLPWDPEATVERLVTEAYAPARRPWHSRLPVASSSVPVGLRRVLLRLSVGRRLEAAGFPRWPAEPLVESVRARVLEAAKAAGLVPDAAPAWPGGCKWAAVLSHDFDSLDAFEHQRWRALAEIEESHGLRSSWHVCTEHLSAALPALEALAERGHEIGWHGPRHDYRFAYLPPERIRTEAAAAVLSLAAFGPRGFRSPNFLRTPGLMSGLSGVFGYDSSARDTAAELFSGPGRRGCCTVFPFMRNGLVELPITIPDDLSVRCLDGDDAERISAVQSAKLEWIRSVGGMAMALTHPEAWISLTPGSLLAYRRLVEAISEDPEAWKTLPRDVEAWWRKRSGPGPEATSPAG